MTYKIKTLSKTSAEYAALELAIEDHLAESPDGIAQEAEFLKKFQDREQIAAALKDIGARISIIDINSMLDLLSPQELVLPTIYDEPVSFTLMKPLVQRVQKAAEKLGFDQSNYGGFCFAPTGKVNAVAIPVEIDESRWKVFVVFESGLLTFIDAVIRLTISATPSDLFAGETPNNWNDAWNRHKSDPRNHDGLHQVGCDLKAWMEFSLQYGRHDVLAHVGSENLPPMRVKVGSLMVEGAELFIVSHEFVHAISGHDDPQLLEFDVEKEADQKGAKITQKVLEGRSDGEILFALAGIGLAIEAIGFHHSAKNPYLNPCARAELVLDSIVFQDSADRNKVHSVVALYRAVFHDLLEFAF